MKDTSLGKNAAEENHWAEASPRRSGLSRTIYEGLRDEIILGKLKPGELLSRRQIAVRYGCSYTPVIEALVRLEHTGLIETESSQMARVSKLSIEKIESTYALREAIETQAIRIACEMATADEIDELYGLAVPLDHQAKECEETNSDGPLLHWRFHNQIAKVCRCSSLVDELERIELHKRLQANWIRIPKLVDPPRWHAVLVDAIRARDPLAADAAMRAHVRSGLEKELAAYRMRIHK